MSVVNSLDYALLYLLIPLNASGLEKCSKISCEIAINHFYDNIFLNCKFTSLSVDLYPHIRKK